MDLAFLQGEEEYFLALSLQIHLLGFPWEGGLLKTRSFAIRNKRAMLVNLNNPNFSVKNYRASKPSRKSGRSGMEARGALTV